MSLIALETFSYKSHRFKAGEKVDNIPGPEIKNLIRQGIVKDTSRKEVKDDGETAREGYPGLS